MRTTILLLPLLLFGADRGPLLDAIRNDDTRAVKALLKSGADPNARDELGATALMHAAAFASEDCMRLLLDKGADVNAASKAGTTALMWSVGEPAKVRLLLARGANANAKAEDGRTALMTARQAGHSEAMRLLSAHASGAASDDEVAPLDRPTLSAGRETLLEIHSLGAEPKDLHQFGFTPLLTATYTGNAEVVRRTLEAGADANAAGQIVTLQLPPLAVAASVGSVAAVRLLLERGADPNAKGSRGITSLMAAAAGGHADEAIARLLIDKGADVQARDEEGRTALDWALLQGETEVAGLLRRAGARAAIEKAVALLQPTSPAFFRKTGCISCHNNSLVSIAVKHAAGRGIAVDASLAAHPVKATMAAWSPARENLLQGIPAIGGFVANVSYGLVSLAEEGFAPNATTDAAAITLARLQRPNGSWNLIDLRPPLGNSAVKFTALTIRALDVYLPGGRRAEWKQQLRRARQFLLAAQPKDTQDQAFLLLGLRWSGARNSELVKYRDQLLALQRDDGGWAQLPTMASDAYATGQALYALRAGGGVAATHAAYRKGVQYLLRTQLEDGSWFVRSRGLAFQPYFDAGFPHERNQFVSAAATAWAVIALSEAMELPLAPRTVVGASLRNHDAADGAAASRAGLAGAAVHLVP